jgi:UTP--glucose-1-phosphate uridylyltransferase
MNLFFWSNGMLKTKIKKAVLPVAGLGTRFLPATKVLPKEMLPVFNKPIIQYAIEEAMEAGIEEFIFVTGRGKVIIEDHFDISYELDQHLQNNNKQSYRELITSGIPKAGKSFFTRQQYPMGLGHAIYCAKALVNNDPFVVLLPDELIGKDCLKNMIDIYNNTDSEIILAVNEVPWENVPSYGILDVSKHIKDSNNTIKINGVVEKPTADKAPSNLAIIGRYILPPSIFDHLEKAQKGVGGEIQLTDSIQNIITENNSLGYIYNGSRHDCGNPLGLLDASLDVAFSMYPDVIKELLKNKLSKYK